jgi:GNAT superfamily N-acetyltransferase
MDEKWVTRGYRPGDEAGIIALWKAAFPDGESGRADPDYWNWQFRDPPAGPARFRLAVAGDQIVGQYAVIPVPMQVGDKAIAGTLSLDTMTHPDYLRQGIFTTLANELYAELGREGFPITYGFPNENSIGPLTKRLQWSYICSLPVYVKPLRPAAIVDSVVSNRILGGIVKPFARLGTAILSPSSRVAPRTAAGLRWLDRFDARADELWRLARDPAKIALTRSAALLNWRYFQNPLREYRTVAYEEDGQLVAYAVLRCMEQFGLRGGMITDWIGRPGRDDALQAVLAAAEEYFREEGTDLVACLLHGDGRAARLLRRSGLLKAPRRAFKEWYFGVRLNDASLPAGWTTNPDNWYLTFGDTDVI